MDADGADDPRQIPDLLDPIIRAGADMVLGSRLAGDIAPGAMPWHQEFGNRLSAGLIRLLYGLPITDLSPFRAVIRSKLHRVGYAGDDLRLADRDDRQGRQAGVVHSRGAG